MQSVKQKTSLDAFHPFSQYLRAIASAIGMTDPYSCQSTYLVNFADDVSKSFYSVKFLQQRID